MTNLNREIQEMIAARAKEPRAFGEALAAEIQGNPSVGDTTTKEAFKPFEDSVDAAFAKNAFMQRSVELGITGSALYQQILATKFANQVGDLKRELEQTVETFTSRWLELNASYGGNVFEAVRGRTSFQNQISIVRNEQMPRLLEVKDLDGLKDLSAFATEETIRWKEQENTLLDRFNAIVTLDQEGDGLQQVTFAVDRAFTSYVCWNQFRIHLRDALQELYV